MMALWLILAAAGGAIVALAVWAVVEIRRRRREAVTRIGRRLQDAAMCVGAGLFAVVIVPRIVSRARSAGYCDGYESAIRETLD